jgi:hypothetical protein
VRRRLGTQFTCFTGTGTKVLALPGQKRRDASARRVCAARCDSLALLSLLALLVPKKNRKKKDFFRCDSLALLSLLAVLVQNFKH